MPQTQSGIVDQLSGTFASVRGLPSSVLERLELV